MEEVAIKMIDMLSEKMGIVVDYTTQNVIPYAVELMERIVQYNIVICGLCILVFVIMIALSLNGFRKLLKAHKDAIKNEMSNTLVDYNRYGCEPTPIGIITIILGTVCTLVGFVCIICTINDLIGWYFIPEMKVIEYLNLIAM